MCQNNRSFDMPNIERCPNLYTSYELCFVLEKHFGKPATYLLQLLHYWLHLENLSLGIIRDDYQWFYNTHSNWLKKLNQNKVYVSLSSIRRGLEVLETHGVVLTCCFEVPGNNVNSYTIDYDRLESLIGDLSFTRLLKKPRSVAEQHAPQNDVGYTNNLTKENNKHAQMNRPINRYITKNTSKNISSEKKFSEISSLDLVRGDQHDQQRETEKNNIPQEMLRLWNEIIEKNTSPVELTSQRSRYLVAAFKQFFNHDLNQWIDFCCKIASSKFLMGESSKSNWRIDLDWALNFYKLQLIRDGSRYTFGDRPVTYNAQRAEQNGDNHTLCMNNKEMPNETAEALTLRTKIQDILTKKYLDENKAHYISWFKDTYIELCDTESDSSKYNLYVKSKFIKDQLFIRYNELCEAFFTAIYIGFPESLIASSAAQNNATKIEELILTHKESCNENKSFQGETTPNESFNTYSEANFEEAASDLNSLKSGSENSNARENEHVVKESFSHNRCPQSRNKSAQRVTNIHSFSHVTLLNDVKILHLRKKIKNFVSNDIYLQWFHKTELVIEKGRGVMYVSSTTIKQHIEHQFNTMLEHLSLELNVKEAFVEGNEEKGQHSTVTSHSKSTGNYLKEVSNNILFLRDYTKIKSISNGIRSSFYPVPILSYKNQHRFGNGVFM